MQFLKHLNVEVKTHQDKDGRAWLIGPDHIRYNLTKPGNNTRWQVWKCWKCRKYLIRNHMNTPNLWQRRWTRIAENGGFEEEQHWPVSFNLFCCLSLFFIKYYALIYIILNYKAL